MKYLLIILLLLLPVPLQAAITIDAITSDDGQDTTEASLTHTAAADATLALACYTERDTTATMGAGPSVTYDGNAMTLVPGATQTTSDSFMKSSLFYYVNPPSGAVTVAGTASTGSDREILSVMTLKGTATTDIFNTAGTVQGTLTNIDIDSLASAVGEFAVMCGAQSQNGPNVSPDATSPVSTERLEVDHADGIGMTHFVYTEDGAATSINMRVDSDTSIRTTAVAVSIRPVASATVRHQAPVLFP